MWESHELFLWLLVNENDLRILFIMIWRHSFHIFNGSGHDGFFIQRILVSPACLISLDYPASDIL